MQVVKQVHGKGSQSVIETNGQRSQGGEPPKQVAGQICQLSVAHDVQRAELLQTMQKVRGQ